MKSYILCLLAFVAISFSSCTKDEEKPVDVRDQLIGTFKGNLTATNSTTVTLATDFLATKSNDGVTLTEITTSLNKLIIKLTSVTKSNDGCGFTIVSQSNTYSSGTITFNGTKNYMIGTSRFDGAYLSANKRIEFRAVGTTSSGGRTFPISFSYVGTKQ
jgi:hypothetical protein